MNIIRRTDMIKSVTLYDLLGRRLLNLSNTSHDAVVTLHLYNLQRALYIVEIRTQNDVYRDEMIKK